MVKLEKEDYVEACKYRWQAIIDNRGRRIGFKVKNSACWITSITDEILLNKVDYNTDNIYWIPMEGNEELLVELLKLENTIENMRD